MTDPCRSCGSTIASVEAKADGFDLLRCGSCNLVYRGPVDSDSSVFYEYYSDRFGMTREQLFNPLTTRRYHELLASLEGLAPGRRLLDVGCGQGQLVHAAATAGWDAFGIDTSAAAIELARSVGVQCDVVDLHAPTLAPSSFDAITLIEVVEHIEDISPFLARVEELLRPGGVAYLTTPNYASLGRRVLGTDWRVINEHHVTYFTPRTLRAVAQHSTRLHPVRVETRNLSAAAIRRLLRRPTPVGAEVPGHEQDLRAHVEGSPALRAVKRIVNVGLRATGLGETLAATFVRGGV